MTACPFCQASCCASSDPAELAYARRDGFPVSKGHTLIIPRRHVESIFQCTEEERRALLTLLDRGEA
jgi:diadenosine tetraphosphate (Ap4A) HIT family hydrolase